MQYLSHCYTLLVFIYFSAHNIEQNVTHIILYYWNSLPDELRDLACGSDSFKQFLKTILFSLY